MGVNRQAGSNYPIMAMQERVLSVLGCRYTDDVLLDAPWQITTEMVKSLGITCVARGTTYDFREPGSDEGGERDNADAAAIQVRRVGKSHPHAVPQAMGIVVELESTNDLTVEVIASRLQARHSETT